MCRPPRCGIVGMVGRNTWAQRRNAQSRETERLRRRAGNCAIGSSIAYGVSDFLGGRKSRSVALLTVLSTRWRTKSRTRAASASRGGGASDVGLGDRSGPGGRSLSSRASSSSPSFTSSAAKLSSR